MATRIADGRLARVFGKRRLARVFRRRRRARVNGRRRARVNGRRLARVNGTFSEGLCSACKTVSPIRHRASDKIMYEG